MKKIGLLGGMSWESSAPYYRLINEKIRERLGGLHSERIIMASVDFAEIERFQAAGAWGEAGYVLGDEARRLQASGADFIVLCTNTMHQVADAIEAATSVPLLHLADATAVAVNKAGVTTVGLLGTAFTMEQSFYKDRLAGHGLAVIVPDESERAIVHRAIYEELVLGVVTETSRQAYVAVFGSLRNRGAEGVILGCTEIEMLIARDDSPIPVFATTQIHAQHAVKMALELS